MTFLNDPSELSAEKALRKGTLDEYYGLLDILHDNLVLLHTNLAILKQLSAFRSDLFGELTNVFHYLCWQNIFEYSILIIRRLWDDPNGINLKTLHSFVYQNTKC